MTPSYFSVGIHCILRFVWAEPPETSLSHSVVVNNEECSGTLKASRWIVVQNLIPE